MEQAAIARGRSFWFALAASLLLHALVLALKTTTPAAQPDPFNQKSERKDARLDVTLQNPPEPTPGQQRKTDQRPQVLAMRPRPDTAPPVIEQKSWTIAERDDMSRFLNELAEEARPPSGRELAQRALAAARHLHSDEPAQDEESSQIMRRLVDARIEPFSLEMYFDALFRKMNRSAAMIGNEKRHMGLSTAAVRILLNQDGSVKSFKILRAADQQAEIDFIQSVVDQAAPFPVFPADIRNATDVLALLICIRPGSTGGANGATFSRMGEGQACR